MTVCSPYCSSTVGCEGLLFEPAAAAGSICFRRRQCDQRWCSLCGLASLQLARAELKSVAFNWKLCLQTVTKRGKGRASGSSAGASRRSNIKVPANINTLVCELCGGGHKEDTIILCDRCDRGCHLFCLNPPVAAVPEGQWVCPLCVLETQRDVAHRVGSMLTLDAFERSATNFQRSWSKRDGCSRMVG